MKRVAWLVANSLGMIVGVISCQAQAQRTEELPVLESTSSPSTDRPEYLDDVQWVAEMSKLSQLSSTYGDDHPLMIETRTRVEAIQSMIDEGIHGDRPIDREIAIEERQLSLLLRRFGNDHPIILSARSRLKSLKAALQNQPSDEAEKSTEISRSLATEKAKLQELSQSFGDDHPQVKQVQNRIAALVKEQRLLRQNAYATPSQRLYAHQMAMERAKLAELEATLGDGHPQVQSIKSAIRVLEKVVDHDRSMTAPQSDTRPLPNKLASIQQELEKNQRDVEEFAAQFTEIKKNPLSTPAAVEAKKDQLRLALARGLQFEQQWLKLRIEEQEKSLAEMQRELSELTSGEERAIESRLQHWTELAR